MYRVECPTCLTSYAAERCGIRPEPGKLVESTVKCITCETSFHVSFVPTVFQPDAPPAPPQSLWDRVCGRAVDASVLPAPVHGHLVQVKP